MQASVDSVTGLDGRTAFLAHLADRVAHTRAPRTSTALMVVDVVAFSRINARHGYAAGDAVLRHVGACLTEVARPCDRVARIGDDRFALLLANAMGAGHVELASQKLQRLLERPARLDGGSIPVRVRAGAAVCAAHGGYPDEVLQRAEAAVERARRDHVPLCLSASDRDNHALLQLWDIESELAGAMERGELQMHFQPKLQTDSLAFNGAEALMRWFSPSHGEVSPEVFIPLAERCGRIKPLTAWALHNALRQAAQWPQGPRALTVSVNLPGVLAAQPDLPDLVAEALALWGTPHVRLMLEITEGSLMDVAHGFDVLERLRAMGVGISIDDFGTGYSCLAYFKSIPADELKVDRSFVQALAGDDDTHALVHLIVQLAHRFRMSVAAEGVEDTATLDALRALGCDTVQGFLMARPMPQAELLAWLHAWPARGHGRIAATPAATATA